jgi:hypothetical protein
MIPLVGDQTGAFSGLEMFRGSKTGTPTSKEWLCLVQDLFPDCQVKQCIPFLMMGIF